VDRPAGHGLRQATHGAANEGVEAAVEEAIAALYIALAILWSGPVLRLVEESENPAWFERKLDSAERR
jgi:hypothetical protein